MCKEIKPGYKVFVKGGLSARKFKGNIYITINARSISAKAYYNKDDAEDLSKIRKNEILF